MMVRLERAVPARLAEVDALFDRLSGYSRAVDGVGRRAGAAREFVTAVPPGRTAMHKHAFILSDEDGTFGLLDIIEDHPVDGTAFIGLFAIAEDRHGVGLGRAAWLEAERFAAGTLGARTLRLGVVSANPVIGFWRRMGFTETGETSAYVGEARTSPIVIMEKTIE